MAQSRFFVILAILIALFSIEASGSQYGTWEPIKHPKDKYILEIGKYAVDEHRKHNPDYMLQFVDVIKGERQVVEGTNYRLTIAAKDITVFGAVSQYEAVVYDKTFGDKIRKLTSFTKLDA